MKNNCCKMPKYVIKNCPAIYNSDILNNICNDLTNYNVCSCENTSDCLLKRIMKLCNDVLEQETDPLNSFEMSFAQKILQLLESEEVE